MRPRRRGRDGEFGGKRGGAKPGLSGPPRPSPTSRPIHQGPLANPVRDQALARIAARARAAQGWCPTIIDTNGDGRITRPWNSGSGLRDPNLDTQLTGFAYGIIVNPVDGSIWITRTGGVPGRIFRLELGGNPPETFKAEVYEPPFETPALPQDEWGFSPRGIDVARDGIIWTALSGSGHLASFDRTKCAVLKGPEATGQHCPEGWDPLPHTRASDDERGHFRERDGRIDDPDAGWKGRAVWADFGTNIPWHLEGGPGTTSKIVKFQIRPNPLAW